MKLIITKCPGCNKTLKVIPDRNYKHFKGQILTYCNYHSTWKSIYLNNKLRGKWFNILKNKLKRNY